MYTLMFIGYVIFSLAIAIVGIKEGEHVGESFFTGFAIIPVIAIALTAVYWVLTLMLFILTEVLDVIIWIYYNMP